MYNLYSSNNSPSHAVADLPPQMVSLKDKDDDFKKKCMDALETIGRSQYLDNLNLLENYEMIKGRFVYNHYFQNEGYTDLMAQLTREFELPSYLRHYDIISQVLNTLIGEYHARPDIFRVKNFSEAAQNEYERTKTDLILQYVTSQINAEVANKMLQQGLDPTKDDFQSDEEAQQYQQMIEQAKQSLTPPEIQEYMDTDWQQAAEIWASHQLELDKSRFLLAEKERREFEDMLVADRCFRHFYLTPNGYNQETWNPVQVFFQKSPDVENIEEGDYVGRTYYLTIPAIIDRFGYLMTKDEIESLQEDKKIDKNKRWNYMAGSEYVYDEYAVPFQGFQVYDTLAKTQGVPKIDSGFYNGAGSKNRMFNDTRSLYMVTEAYWKTQEKLGKVTYIDPETGIRVKKLVDETFIVPDHFTQLDSAFSDSDDDNTVVWTWINRVWKGVKINLKGSGANTDLYLNIGPVDFQFKGDYNPYDAKLPVCGSAGFSARNSRSMSLVDLMKPYQIFYNVAMNQLYQICEREIGRFAVMDVNMFPDAKDWGGEKSMEKFMLVAKELGFVPADTSPQNISGAIAATGGYLPKDFNWDDSSRMVSRMTLAEKFEQMALRQVGFNQYRLGAFGAEATAGGVENGKQASYSQTDVYFTQFSNYVRRCHEMDLAIAQYTQAKNTDVAVMNIKSDLSRTFIKVLGTDLLVADLKILVVNAPEFIKQTEMLRQWALQNTNINTSGEDVAAIITANSPAEIKIKLKESTKRLQEQQQQQMQAEQKQHDDEMQLRTIEIQKVDERLDKTLQNALDVAYINHGMDIIKTDPTDTSAQDDIKSKQVDIQSQTASATASATQQKLELQRQKQISDNQFRDRQLAVQQANIEKDLAVQREKLAVVQTMKGKETKKSK